MSAVEFINGVWPVFIGFITLVIILAKMHSDIESIKKNDLETIKEKIRVLFELWNNRK
jgi:hypothetical protein